MIFRNNGAAFRLTILARPRYNHICEIFPVGIIAYPKSAHRHQQSLVRRTIRTRRANISHVPMDFLTSP